MMKNTTDTKIRTGSWRRERGRVQQAGRGLSPCAILEEDTTVGGAIFGANTRFSLGAIWARWSLVARSSVVAGRASRSGWSFVASWAGASVGSGGTILTGWSGGSVLAWGSSISGGWWHWGGGVAGWSLLSILAWGAGRAVGTGWAGWSVAAILARAAWVAVGARCTGLARGARGSGGTWWAWLAWRWGHFRADLQWWASGDTRGARHTGFAGLAVLSWSSWWARETGQAAVIASSLTLGDRSVVRNVGDGDRSELVHFAHHVLG